MKSILLGMDENRQEEQPEIPRSTADYANYAAPEKQSRAPKLPSFNWRRPAKYLLVLLILAGLGAGLYEFVLKDKPDTGKTGNPANQQPTGQPKNDAINTDTEHHVSQQFALEFDYPADWTINEVEASGRLSATSPDIQLTDGDGRPVTGQIILTIRSKQQPLPEFEEDSAVAARNSEKIDYAKPSPNQRASTYLSLVRLGSSVQAEGDFDGVYITGDMGYQKDQAVPKADISKVDPLISVTFTSGGTPLTVSDNIWDNPNYSDPILAMLKSLIIN